VNSDAWKGKELLVRVPVRRPRGGLHLNPGGALLAAATGTPLVVYAFHRRFHRASPPEEVRADSTNNEVAYVNSKTDKSD